MESEPKPQEDQEDPVKELGYFATHHFEIPNVHELPREMTPNDGDDF